MNYPLDYTLKILDKKIKKALNTSKRRSSKKNVDFNLDCVFLKELFLKQEGLCFYTGKCFYLDSKTETLSLDRIVGGKGYTKGNVVWCKAGINYLKHTENYTKMKKTCIEIILHTPDWKILNVCNRLR